MTLPKTLAEWPDEIPYPEKLGWCGEDCDCLAMHVVRCFGGSEDEVEIARNKPVKVLERMGVSAHVAMLAVIQHDDARTDADRFKAFDFLMATLGYEIVEE